MALMIISRGKYIYNGAPRFRQLITLLKVMPKEAEQIRYKNYKENLRSTAWNVTKF